MIDKPKQFLGLLLILLGIGLIPLTVTAQDDDAVEDEPMMEESSDEESSDAPMQVPPRGKKGKVTITTTPAKATVYLGGVELGESPIENHEFKSGRHDLTIMLRGEELVRTRFNVWPDKNNTFDKKLVMPYGSIIVDVNKVAKVYVDGEYMAQTEGGPLTINNVEEGPHILKVQRGKKSRQQEIHVKGEDTVTVKLSL